MQSHKRLRELNNQGKAQMNGSSQDCSICLGPIAVSTWKSYASTISANSLLQPCQSLFVAPCSHTWHYKCIRVIINGPHWPHFICPNCRTVADLEAELEDPFGNGEWEELDATSTCPPLQDSARSDPLGEIQVTDTPRAQRQQNGTSEHTTLGTQREDSEQDNTGPSDMEIADISDDSGVDARVHRATGQLEHLHLEDSSAPSSSADRNSFSNATSAPVDIITRKPVANGAIASHLEDPTSERGLSRTPSPNGLGASLNEALTGVDGPMTPRNDAGPFIFDGSAGRIATANLNAAANIDPQHLEVEPAS